MRVSEFDPSAFLDDHEVVAEYLTAALQDANPDVFLAAVGNVVKARGMSALGRTRRPWPRGPLEVLDNASLFTAWCRRWLEELVL